MSMWIVGIQSERAAKSFLGPRPISPCLVDIAKSVVSLFGRVYGGGALILDLRVPQSFRVEQKFSVVVVSARGQRGDGCRNPVLPLRFAHAVHLLQCFRRI